MKNTNQVRHAYIAGFLDGEGCFDIRASNRKNGRKYFSTRVRAAQVAPEVLYEIKNEFGGIIAITKSKNPKWKDKYELQLSNAQVEVLLDCIQPYSVVKKPQIEILKEFIESRKQQTSFRKTEEDFSREQILQNKIKELNSAKTAYVAENVPQNFKEISEEQKAYYAGFTDGEGCIGISGTVNKFGAFQTNLTVQITQCDPEVLSGIQSLLGGGMTTIKLNENNKKQSNCSRITLAGKRAAAFLDLIKDHVIVKRNQVLNGLSYWNFRSLPREKTMEKVKVGNGGWNWKRSESTIKKEKNFYNLMKVLNKRGN